MRCLQVFLKSRNVFTIIIFSCLPKLNLKCYYNKLFVKLRNYTTSYLLPTIHLIIKLQGYNTYEGRIVTYNNRFLHHHILTCLGPVSTLADKVYDRLM